MKIEVLSNDRLGISQEILSAIAQNHWNVLAMEVITQAIYLNIEVSAQSHSKLIYALSQIEGVITVNEIDLLPTESREQHLNAMLGRIPEPIFDIDINGVVLSTNISSQRSKNTQLKNNATKKENNKYIQSPITQLLNISLKQVLDVKPQTIEVNFDKKLYLAEITPVMANLKVNGAVIVLKEIAAVGRQISLLQQGKAHHIDSILGESQQILALKHQLLKFSTLDLPILITGETGTGKELFARAIHEASSRNNAPFLAINCASLSEQLLESELFGYVAGAFTGAQKNGKPGLFELADGGTVFLDEVAEMSGYLQAKLLRFLQDYSYRRLGGTTELTANVRIISASHQKLEHMIDNKTFREDLYYRLNVLSLSLPALRDRKKDISLLSEYFLKNAVKQVNLKGIELTEQAKESLIHYSWPGNVRQLQNVLFRLVALSTDNWINEHHVIAVLNDFKHSIEHENTIEMANNQSRDWLSVKDWQSAQQLFEQELLAQFQPVYKSTRKLAERLGVSHNKIAMKLRKFNLNNQSE